MLLRVLGGMDVLAGLIVLLHYVGVASDRLLISFIAYLVLKGIMFLGDFASTLDFIVSFCMVVMLFYSNFWLTVIVSLYLLQKGFFSLY